MLREKGVLQTREINGAQVYTCGYRDSVTRVQVSFTYVDGDRQERTATLDIVLGGLEIGMGQARKKIQRAITEYKQIEEAREISARQQGFFDRRREPPKQRHKKEPSYVPSRSWLSGRF